jgi:hypothetical protein
VTSRIARLFILALDRVGLEVQMEQFHQPFVDGGADVVLAQLLEAPAALLFAKLPRCLPVRRGVADSMFFGASRPVRESRFGGGQGVYKP